MLLTDTFALEYMLPNQLTSHDKYPTLHDYFGEYNYIEITMYKYLK